MSHAPAFEQSALPTEMLRVSVCARVCARVRTPPRVGAPGTTVTEEGHVLIFGESNGAASDWHSRVGYGCICSWRQVFRLQEWASEIYGFKDAYTPGSYF